MSSYSVIKKPSTLLIGIECRTSNAPEAGPHDIPKHWEKFYHENTLSKIPNKISDDVFALYCDYEGDYTQPYSLVIGCIVHSDQEIPLGMVAKKIPSGSYALFRAIGHHPKSLIETWGHIWSAPLKRTYTGDYELYNMRLFSEQPQEVQVFVAITE